MGYQPTPETKSVDLINFILSHFDIPLVYSRVCAILVTNERIKFGMPLKHNELIKNYQGSQFFFRILHLPNIDEVKHLNPAFLEILQQQVNQLLLNGSYFADLEPTIRIAAMRCAIEFGKYNASKHSANLLEKQIKQYVPKIFYKVKNLSQMIVKKWSENSAIYPMSSRAQIITFYLNTVMREVRQFGCASMSTLVESVNGKTYNTPILLNARQDAVFICTKTGEIVQECGYDQCELNFSDGINEEEFSIYLKKDDEFMICKAAGQASFRRIVEFLRSSTYPTQSELEENNEEEEIEEVIEIIEEEEVAEEENKPEEQEQEQEQVEQEEEQKKEEAKQEEQEDEAKSEKSHKKHHSHKKHRSKDKE